MRDFLKSKEDFRIHAIRGCLASGATPYSQEELQYIIDNYGKKTLKEIAKNIGRSYPSIKSKRRNMALEPSYRFYCQREDEFIIQHCATHTCGYVAHQLNRSLPSVYERARVLGVSFLKVSDDSPATIYPQADVELIRCLYDEGVSYSDIADKFDMTPDYIGQICRFQARLHDNTENATFIRSLQKSAIDGRN